MISKLHENPSFHCISVSASLFSLVVFQGVQAERERCPVLVVVGAAGVSVSPSDRVVVAPHVVFGAVAAAAQVLQVDLLSGHFECVCGDNC